MLKKTLKKLIATALAVATVATTMVAPVSASTLTPKKSHSEAQITEYVDYFNEITDDYTFRPDGYVPVFFRGTHASQSYDAWQMTVMLQNTPGIDDEQKADMKKAASKWKKSYLSERMIYIYHYKWSRVYAYVGKHDTTSRSWASKYKAYAKKIYDETNAYIVGKAKYNQKLAGELRKFNKQRLDTYNKAIDNWFYRMSKKQQSKYGSTVSGGGANAKPEPLFTFYISSMCNKSKMSVDPHYVYARSSASIAVDDYGDKNNYRTGTLKLNPFNGSVNAPNNILNKHINWKKW